MFSSPHLLFFFLGFLSMLLSPPPPLPTPPSLSRVCALCGEEGGGSVTRMAWAVGTMCSWIQTRWKRQLYSLDLSSRWERVWRRWYHLASRVLVQRVWCGVLYMFLNASSGVWRREVGREVSFVC